MKSFTSGGVAVVIGAGGLGSALVGRLLASASFDRIVVGSRSPEKVRQLFPGRSGRSKIQCEAVDLSDSDSVQSLAATLGSTGQPLRLVICATGVLHRGEGIRPERRLEDVEMDALTTVFTVNAFGPMLVARHLAPLLPRRERSVFAAISARVGSIGDNRLGGWYAYRASKAALNQFLRCTAIELRRRAPEAVVAALHPGTVDTPLSAPFKAGVPRDRLFSADTAAARMLHMIDRLSPDDSGGFYAWDGSPIPW